MDTRCLKFWEDGQELVRDGARPALPKVLKELRTMSRFLQKNQATRFSDGAQQKLVDCAASYVALAKQRVPVRTDDDQQLVEAVFTVVKDALAMPFNVMGTKQKKRLMKWYNELIGAVPDALADAAADGATDAAAQALTPVQWNVLGVDDDGYLSLLDDASGETSEMFQVKKKSKDFKLIQKALESAEVVVVTLGDKIIEIRVVDEEDASGS
ncbi:hypothetical protein PybrP1_002340 [[Pythium] brassicae (nom. inval.)]|nr:hypothetical protein PybrP1_002340 [[Pythium] brassicae (nom. inval.)]